MIIAGRKRQERDEKYKEQKTIQFLNEFVLKHKTTI